MFTVQASHAGKAFTDALKDSLTKGPVVVYFYPRLLAAAAPSRPALSLAIMSVSLRRGRPSWGVSLDDIGRLNAFSSDPETYAGKVAVAFDADGKIAAPAAVQQASATQTSASLLGTGQQTASRK